MRQVPRVRPQVAPTLRKPPQTPAVVQQGMTAVQKPLMQSTTQPPPEVKKPSATGPLTLHVYSKADKDEIGIETLVGEYVEMGTNHGKKFFKRKKGAEGIEEVTVFLYFWDNRDGADFGGWWFGDKVGGAQVWSRCEKADMLPPASGWRIPWDGPVQNALVVESQMQQAKPAVAVPAKVEAKEETKTEVADVVKTEPELDERVQRATDRVVLAEIEATQALESSSAMMEGEVSDESLQVVEELLVAQQTTMTESHKSLAAEIIEARKVSPKSVAALSKLTPRLRSVQASLVAEIARAKQLSKRKLVEAEEKQKRAHAEEVQLQAEQRDAKALEESLPVAMDVVTKAEDMIEVVITTASPLAVEFAEEMSESVSNLLQETEEAAGKAHEAIQAARKEVNSKISAATNFAPEARKVALAEFSSLQDKLNESEKKLAPYLRIRKEYEHKLSAKKVMTEVASKLGSVEIEVDKVTSLLMGSSSTSRDEIKAAEASLAPVMHSLTTAMKFVEERMQGAQGALKDDLSQMQERGKETEKRVSSFRLQLRSKMDQLQLQNLLSQGLEKTQHAEDLLEKTVSAETPLVKGLDELEKEEASEAIAASEASAKAAEVAASQAKAFLKAKLVDAKSFPDATRKPTVDELIQLQNRVDAVSQKVAAFKRESAQRKTVLLLREVTEKVDIVETRVQQAVRAAEPLSMEKLEEVPTSTLKQITDQTLEAEKAAALAFADARKALVTKQRDGQAWESPSFAAELTKLQGKLNSAKQELDKQRKLTLQAEKLWKSKELVKDKEEAMKQVESEVERVEILTTPLGDERPSTESIKEMDAAVNAVQQSLNEVVSSLEVAQHTAQGSLKVQLVKLLVRTKKSQEKLNEIKALTQEQRERVACEQILKEARAKLVGLDEAFQKVSDAETPYLKGDEILAVDEATQAVADSEAAAAAVQQAIHATRTFLTAKSLEVRGFVDAVAKMGLQEIGLLASKNEEGAERLAQFKKETEGRKRIAQHQQALAKASDAEEAVQKTILASTPLAAKNVDEIQPEEAHEFCERLLEAEKEAQAKLNDARKFLMDRQRERKGQSELSELSQLLARLNSAQVDLAKAKTTASEHEQKFVARMLMQQADEIAREVDSELEKAVEAAAPLTVDGGKMFVAASMTKMILEALTEYMNEKGLTKESLFQQMSKGSTDGRCARADCLAFLEKIPEMCGRPDLAVSSEHGSAIFDQLDSKAEGSISSKEFNDAFRERYICIHGTSVTDGFEVAASKTVAKLEADEVVEALAEPRSHDTSGVMRVHVRLLKDDTTGWVTMQGSEGTMYLGPFTAYASFMKSLDKAMTSAMSASAKAANFVNQKGEDVQDCKQGPLADAKVELTKLRSQVSVMQMKLDQLKKRVEEGKKEHSKREELERKKQEEKKDRRAASLILKAISDKVSNAQAGLSKMEGQASPLTSVSEADLGKVSSPLEVSKASAASFDEVLSLVAEAKECIKAHEGKVLKAPKGPWSELKQAMSKQQREVFVIGKKANEIMSKVRILCNNFIASKQGEVAQAFRKQIQQRGISIDKLYDELAGKKGDQIPQEKFSKALDKLPDLTLSSEHKKMLFQLGETGGVSRRAFFKMLERYYKCVKDIAITSDFDIKTSNTLRKLEVGEVVEILEGPRSDETLGVVRVRARAVSDGKSGWVTVKGNQGTPFLQETGKPCYCATQTVEMRDGFPSEEGSDIGTLMPGEVVEVIEGPKKESVSNALRARGKASKDGAVGWFTVQNKQGQTCAEPGRSCYVCKAVGALTDNMQVKQCQVVRKLERGETLIVLEGPVEDESAGVTRIHARATKDGREGWVTTKGNAGSLYAEESGRQYTITKAVSLESDFDHDVSTTIRTLEEQESIELLDAPREEQSEPLLRLHCRKVSDGKVGWLTLNDKLKSWFPNYKCIKEVALYDNLEEGKAQSLRMLSVGEILELIEGPKPDPATQSLRMKGRALKDSAIGWVTVCSKDGEHLLDSVPSK